MEAEASGTNPARKENEYRVEIKTRPSEEDSTAWKGVPTKGELFLYQLRGTSTIRIRRAANSVSSGSADAQEPVEMQLPAGHVLLVPGKEQFELQYDWADGGSCLAVTNSVIVTDQ